MIKTDILIIGAGPVGIFTVLRRTYETKMPSYRYYFKAGGQLTEIYPKNRFMTLDIQEF